MTDMLPCPFCGNKPHRKTYDDEDIWSHDLVQWLEVGCNECNISFSWPVHAIEDDDNDANPILRWNTRIK
jgi:hypothetical protein